MTGLPQPPKRLRKQHTKTPRLISSVGAGTGGGVGSAVKQRSEFSPRLRKIKGQGISAPLRVGHVLEKGKKPEWELQIPCSQDSSRFVH